jgi:ribosomal protein S18 acetylase RimI-like enzyme
MREMLGRFGLPKAIEPEALFESILENYMSLSTKDDTFEVCMAKSGVVIGVALVQKSDWDSRLLGLSMGKAVLFVFDPHISNYDRTNLARELKSESVRHHLNMIVLRIPLGNWESVQAFQAAGGLLCDILVTYGLESSCVSVQAEVQPVDTRIEIANEEHAESLSNIAMRTITQSHFHNDSRLAKSRVSNFYSEWVLNSLRTTNQRVFVSISTEKVTGFIACKKSTAGKLRYGVIDLIAVGERYQGVSVGSRLVEAGLGWLSQGTDDILVGTQVSNPRAMVLYQKFGFKPRLAEGTFHMWTSNEQGGS